MNKLPADKEELLDRMMCMAYPVRVIAEVAQVSRNSILVRRAPMVYGRGFWFVNCPCGKAVIDPDTDHFHDQEPCKRRSRRNRLLLRIIRKKRTGAHPAKRCWKRPRVETLCPVDQASGGGF